jgi:hypothetical protein
MKRADIRDRQDRLQRRMWNYVPDLATLGRDEARHDDLIQPPGTATMGHLYLDAQHATGDNFYYQAAEQVAGALIWGQHSSGGWNYMVDFAGDRSLREWYDTIGKNGWRLEEFQHYWGNATFDDAGTAESAKFLRVAASKSATRSINLR